MDILNNPSKISWSKSKDVSTIQLYICVGLPNFCVNSLFSDNKYTEMKNQKMKEIIVGIVTYFDTFQELSFEDTKK